MSSYKIVANSPSSSNTNQSNIIDKEKPAWLTHSTPSFLVLKFATPTIINTICFVNSGASFVEILGLPEAQISNGINADDSLYQTILPITTLASIADWKSQKNLNHEYHWRAGQLIDPSASSTPYTQIKVIIRGYNTSRPIGINFLEFNGPDGPDICQSSEESKPGSRLSSLQIPLPTSADYDSDSDSDDKGPGLSKNASFLFAERKQQLAGVLEQAAKEPSPAVSRSASNTSSSSQVQFVVNVANQEEFDPDYHSKMQSKEEILKASAPKQQHIPKETVATARSSSTVSSSSATSKAGPLSNIILCISGIGPERSEIRKILTEMGGTYSHDWVDNPPSDKTLILLVDAPSDQWHGTPKHQAAVAQKVPVVDRSWIQACHKKNLNLPVGPYLAEFRTGKGKAAPSSSSSIASFMTQPSKGKTSIKSEGGAFSTEKASKEDEEEDDGPNEYVFDDFVVPDDEPIEEEDSMDWEESEMVKKHHAPPQVSKHNQPPRHCWSPEIVAQKWDKWLEKVANLTGSAPKSGSSSNPHVHKAPSKVEEMEVDEVRDDASDGTNPIDPSDLSELNRTADLW